MCWNQHPNFLHSAKVCWSSCRRLPGGVWGGNLLRFNLGDSFWKLWHLGVHVTTLKGATQWGKFHSSFMLKSNHRLALMEVGTWVCRACAFFIISIFWSLWTCSQEASLSNRKSAREECRASKANRWSWGETQRTEKGRSSIKYAAGFGVWFSWWDGYG